jgi:Flp pilus assembly protein TadD
MKKCITLIFFFSTIVSFSQNENKSYDKAFGYFQKGKNAKTLSVCNKLLKTDTTNAELFHLKAMAEMNLQKDAVALVDLNKAIELKKDFGEAYCDRGVIYWSLGKLNLACKDWKKSKELGWKMADTFLEVKCAQ